MNGSNDDYDKNSDANCSYDDKVDEDANCGYDGRDVLDNDDVDDDSSGNGAPLIAEILLLSHLEHLYLGQCSTLTVCTFRTSNP